jgi:hypothetical protein
VEPKIEWNTQTDKYGNQVSIITLENTKSYRMVSHSKPHHESKRYTIYAGRNKFVRAKIFTPTDQKAVSCEIAGYGVQWGNTSAIAENCPGGPDLKNKLARTTNPDETIIAVINAIQTLPDMWSSHGNLVV